jgi:hypothetical protein
MLSYNEVNYANFNDFRGWGALDFEREKEQ